VVWNHAPVANPAGCGEPVLLARPGEDLARVRSKRAAQMATLREVSREGAPRRYVHLIDGGLSDNVNTTGPLEYFEQFGGFVRAARHVGYRGVRRSVFIVVNAETSRRSSDDATPEIPGPVSTVFALADIPINRNSETSLQKMRTSIRLWEAEVRTAHAQGDFEVFAEDAKFYLIEVDLRVHPAGSGPADLESVPTSLQLPAGDIDALRRFARDTLRGSAEFQRLLADLH
jgi:NTE family protein